MDSIGVWWIWAVFFLIIICVIFIDLFLLGGNKRHRVSTKEALLWSLTWVVLALLFNVMLWFYLANQHSILLANQKSLEFFTAYLIEKSLSIDNIFVFVMIFKYFNIPGDSQHRLLLLGVLGAIIMRLVIILFGIWLVEKFDWIFYLFGLLLIISAIKILTINDQHESLDNNFIIKLTNKFFRTTNDISAGSFFIKKNNLVYFTPLFTALIFIEVSDLIFAIDSIPAVLAITQDPFIAFTSNVFAILGLRAMYFLIANLEREFSFIKYGLACILMVIGIKMFLHHLIDVPVIVTLFIVTIVLLLSIILSLVFKKQ